ncbi:hypothetical protein ACFL1C_03825 [Pseudomonadota bacterium]
MNYQEFRQNLNVGEFISDIYVEVRGDDSNANIVGFFLIRDHFESPSDLFFDYSRYEPIYIRSIFRKLNIEAPAYWVYCDRELTQFNVVSFPYAENNSSALDAQRYQAFLEGLGNVQLSCREARPPRYAQLLSSYSVWHYSLDWVCKCRDLDYIEIREDTPVAILEVTGRLNSEAHLKNSLNQIRNRLVLQQRIMGLTENFLRVKSYFVLHTADLDRFYVFGNDWRTVGRFDCAGYRDWLESLSL